MAPSVRCEPRPRPATAVRRRTGQLNYSAATVKAPLLPSSAPPRFRFARHARSALVIRASRARAQARSFGAALPRRNATVSALYLANGVSRRRGGRAARAPARPGTAVRRAAPVAEPASGRRCWTDGHRERGRCQATTFCATSRCVVVRSLGVPRSSRARLS
jgi:hypothetical protein